MKKLYAGFVALMVLPFFAVAQTAPKGGAVKTAVIYYSLSGQTDTVAKQLAKAYKADIFQIQTTSVYPALDKEVRDIAQKEQSTENWPAIKPLKIDMAKYDVIFIGSPVWFSTVANPVMTFLRQTDFAGKKVITFGTGAGGEGQFFVNFEKAIKNGHVTKGLMFINPLKDKNVGRKITDWVKALKL